MIAGVVAAALGVAALAGCSAAKLPDACARGPGLSEAAMTGAELPKKTLALTFDGGPADATQAIGEYLFGAGLGAAFFVTGEQAGKRPDVLDALRRRGHLVGNLGYGGERLTEAEAPALSVRRTDELIGPYVVGGMYLLRAPEGAFDDELVHALNAAGLGRYVGPVQWDVGEGEGGFVDAAACWRTGVSVDACAQGYLDRIRQIGRGIVRLEAEHTETEMLLRLLVSKLAGEGYTFVRLDEVPLVETALRLRGASPGAGPDERSCDEY
jgi:peptidoglycan/xylan/chitin deacetylase (PgdA/CDA1 family)